MAYTTINKSTNYFNTKTYTGNGGTQSITGVGFQPDFTWIKHRTDVSNSMVQDAVRGSTKHFHSNTNDIEVTDATGVTSFDTDGFSIGSNGNVNATGNVCSWNWKANGAGSANTDGSINSTVSVNQTAGFSIVSWTGNAVAGATIGHGLGVKPSMIILKNRTPDTASWTIYHSSLGATKYLVMEGNNAVQTSNTRWYDAEPTNQVFTVGSSGNVTGDNSGETFVAYCFAEKTGYSKFGTYTGNGNVNGPFVYTGFKPAFVMIKRTDSTGSWYMLDNKRNTFNVVTQYLKANETTADSSVDFLDFTSNGFKMISTGADVNSSGASHIYMAFGQSLVGSNNVPCTGR
jgi:hypothetical protein